jgi:hypothetical protein
MPHSSPRATAWMIYKPKIIRLFIPRISNLNNNIITFCPNTARDSLQTRKIVGWVEERNPTFPRRELGYAKPPPNLQLSKTYAVLPSVQVFILHLPLSTTERSCFYMTGTNYISNFLRFCITVYQHPRQ